MAIITAIIVLDKRASDSPRARTHPQHAGHRVLKNLRELCDWQLKDEGGRRESLSVHETFTRTFRFLIKSLILDILWFFTDNFTNSHVRLIYAITKRDQGKKFPQIWDFGRTLGLSFKHKQLASSSPSNLSAYIKQTLTERNLNAMIDPLYIRNRNLGKITKLTLNQIKRRKTQFRTVSDQRERFVIFVKQIPKKISIESRKKSPSPAPSRIPFLIWREMFFNLLFKVLRFF